MHVGNYRPGNVTIPSYMQINVCKFNIRGSALCNNSFLGEGRRGEGGGGSGNLLCIYSRWKYSVFVLRTTVDHQNTVEPRFNDLRSNDIPGITINIRYSGKSYSKMYGAEPRLTIFGLTMGILFLERKIFRGITIKSI